MQILSTGHTGYEEAQQLDLLSFISEHALPELGVKAKETRAVVAPKASLKKVNSYHVHGNLDPDKSFSSLCVGRPNFFAVEAIKRFIVSEQKELGMIFLTASSGMGKSHILQSIAKEMTELKRSFYFSSPLLMSPIVDTFNMLKFYDIILIDDIEEIEGNYELQKIFCQLIDFAQAGKIKLVIASSKLPKDLSACEDRMKGKLSSALIHHVHDMDSDLAYAIVEARSEAMNLHLPESVKRLVSNQQDFNVYGFLSLLRKFKNSIDINGQKITMELALDEIKDKKVQYRPESFTHILDAVADSFQVSRQELMSSVRKKEFSLARHAAMYVLKERNQLSVMKVAEIFERDHSSVIHGIAKIKKQLDSDQFLKDKITPHLKF